MKPRARLANSIRARGASPFSLYSLKWQVMNGTLSASVSTEPKYSLLARLTNVGSGRRSASRLSASAMGALQKS